MKQKKKAFTLVELLVVIAIIGILIGMLLPAIQQVRESARRIDCMNNLRQIGLATINFHDTHNAFPPSRIASPANVDASQQCDGPESWFVRVLPFVEQQNLYDLWDFSLPYESQADAARATPISAFLCSSRHTLGNATTPTETLTSAGGG